MKRDFLRDSETEMINLKNSYKFVDTSIIKKVEHKRVLSRCLWLREIRYVECKKRWLVMVNEFYCFIILLVTTILRETSLL